MEVTVKDILTESFALRSENEKLKIILGGKPRPKKFKSEFYDKEQWLTACDVKNAFFCWPCLLFAQETNSEWNSTGFSSSNNNIFGAIVDAFGEHKVTPTHINGVLKLQLFLNKNLVPVTIPSEIGTLVKKNRDVVKRIVDVMCHIARIKTPVSNGVSVCEQHLVKDCIEYLSVLKAYDLHNSSDEAINLIIACPKVLTDVVSTLTKLIATEIKNEVQTSTYVSLIFSEHSEINLKAKVSNVLRYIKDGKVHERFIGFSNCIVYKSSALMNNHILGILTKFEIGKKLLAFSCDGSVLSMKHLKAVLMYLHTKFQGFQFAPCYYHDFDFVLQQSVSEFQECRLFFQNLKSIKRFLQNSSQIRVEFNSFISNIVPNLSDLCDLKLSDSQFLRVLRLHRRKFIQFFNSIVMYYNNYIEGDVVKASGFATLLVELQTIFLLESFYMLFESTAIFSETLSSCYPENVFEKSIIENLKATLNSNRETGFITVWSQTMAVKAEVSEKLTRETELSKKRSYYQLYNKVMDHLASEIEIRFICLEKLNFFHSLNSECQGKFLVSDDHLQNLMATYGHCIDENMLQKELDVINSNNTELLGNSVYQLLQTLVSMNLQNILKNVLNLAELILSMPCKPPSSPADTSKHNLIKAWSTVLENGSMENGSMLDDFSVLAVEIDVLQQVKSQDKFYDEFMSTFQNLNNTLQVI